jgi:hypothetical protein
MISDLETIKISQLPQASTSQPSDRFPIAQNSETKSIEPGLLSTDWRPLGVTPTVVSSNGQKEHVIRFASVDYSGTIPVGGKLRIPRTGTTPTASMAFVASSAQYASKASPTGISFVDDYTLEAWVYLDSYATDYQGIISRRDADVSGFSLSISANGQIEVASLNSSAYRLVQTYQSIPLNKWTHVAATVDLSGGTWITYIDGVQVTNYMFATTGTVSAIIQPAQPIVLGSRKSSTQLLTGKVANARVWSTIRTAAEIRDNMNKENPASTTGLVAHYKGNGSWNDSSTNANHLTAVGGAVNSFASHPYSAIEYAIVTKVTYTGGNTDVTVFTGSGCLPNETFGASSYSTARTPFGFPADRSKWRLSAIDRSAATQPSPLANTWYNPVSFRMAIPTGSWDLSYHSNFYIDAPTATVASTNLSLTAASSNAISSKLTSVSFNQSGGGLISKHYGADSVTVSTQSTVHLNGIFNANGTTMGHYVATSQNTGGGTIYAECPYL